MGEVLDLVAEREAREASEPHLTGDAKCLACGHVWVAVAPVGSTSCLECPSCSATRGAFMGAVLAPGGYVWRCDCGNDVFNLTPDGAMCLGCAAMAKGW